MAAYGSRKRSENGESGNSSGEIDVQGKTYGQEMKYRTEGQAANRAIEYGDEKSTIAMVWACGVQK